MPKMTSTNPVDAPVAKILFQQHLQFQRFLTKHLGDAALAEDILQECLAKALLNSGQIRNEESIIAWFYRILRIAMNDYFRHRSADQRKKAGLLSELIAQGEVHSNPAMDVRSEVCGCFSGLLSTLKPDYAELLREIDLGGQSLDQAATRLGITKANLNVKLHRARQALKISLERTCGTCAKHGCLDCQCE